MLPQRCELLSVSASSKAQMNSMLQLFSEETGFERDTCCSKSTFEDNTVYPRTVTSGHPFFKTRFSTWGSTVLHVNPQKIAFLKLQSLLV